MTLLDVVSVSKSFAGTPVLRELSLNVNEGEILCLLGPSGCGKTTLLRIIAGLETADEGHVSFAGRPLESTEVHRRGFGLMFQDFALFPNKDVKDNIAFGLRMRGHSREWVQRRVAEVLDLVGLSGYERRRVYELSGGEQQRVALARSLAPGPRLLMLDEPLGSLDRALREGLMAELRDILKQVGVTSIYVTHDQQEAFAVGDRVAIMQQGRILQEGTPQSVYRNPATPWVARFLGLTNLIPGEVASFQPLRVDTALGRLDLGEDHPAPAKTSVMVLIRPEAALLAAGHCDATAPVFKATVRGCSYRGSRYRLRVQHESGVELIFEFFSGAEPVPEAGAALDLVLDTGAVSLLGEGADDDQAPL